jgi:mxaK protein
MGSRIKRINLGLALLMAIGIAGTSYESYQCWKIDKVNQVLSRGQTVTDEDFPYQHKYSIAYALGNAQNYKHAVQSYSQLLETTTSHKQQADIQYNIGNNLFLSGLQRRVNDDGSLKDDAKYDFAQAKVAYEQALRLDPASRSAKFNLSLLLSLIPQNMKSAAKEQSAMELSNLPIGLP